MIQQRHRTTSGAYLAGDLGATLAAFLTAWVLRFHIEVIPVTKNVPEFEPYLRLLPFILAIWPVVFYFHGLYQSRRGKSRVDEVLTVAVAVLLATVLLLVVIFLYRPPTPDGGYFTYSRAFLGLFALGNFLFVSTVRMILRSVLLRIRQSNNNLQRILVVGAGLLGREITQKLLAHRELGFEVVGFLDDDAGKVGSTVLGVPVLGTLRQAEEVLAVGRIDQVFIALPLEAHRKMLQMLELMARECVEVKLVPDVLQYATLQATLEDVDGTPVINLSQVPLQGWNSMVKRSMDLLIAAAALVVLVPFLPLVALAIWFEDRGPIFYRQERMGLDGKPFMIVKFRSMRINAEATSGPVWAIKGDPRRTRIGAFLRHWSLDELPQIWNVLMGDMSIIGPRPERPTFVREFKHKIPRYMLRHRVKAGITGWAQVHGWRGNTSIKKRIQYDLYYIQNWSLKLDFKILWMTVRHALRHNAY
ncbi:MAG TPA: undecaprenyl-phosphate glucose phosphotransferase, partial [Thermoanaerobaculia bacterium]|nr:undecaprenyl-phosphate glucose phosphotransferase [Thermoanaerobaculia bacterium]